MKTKRVTNITIRPSYNHRHGKFDLFGQLNSCQFLEFKIGKWYYRNIQSRYLDNWTLPYLENNVPTVIILTLFIPLTLNLNKRVGSKFNSTAQFPNSISLEELLAYSVRRKEKHSKLPSKSRYVIETFNPNIFLFLKYEKQQSHLQSSGSVPPLTSY